MDHLDGRPSESVKELARQAGQLSAEERAELADLLLESLNAGAVGEIESAWEAEIDRRVAAFERGDLRAHEAEEVFASARLIAR